MANMNSQYDQLPKMAEFIASYLDEYTEIEDTDSTTCTICQEDFDQSDRTAFEPVRMPRCQHLFHLGCIKEWLNSTQANRNLCPTCRDPLCRLNVLSPQKEASRQAENDARDGNVNPWNIHAYAVMLARVDELFDEQLHRWALQGREDYVRVHRTVRDQWDRECFNIVICDNHWECGTDWIEMAAASRVRARIYDADVEYSWSACQFLGLFGGLRDEFDRRYGYNAESEHGVDDNSESVAADQPSEAYDDTVGGEQHSHGEPEVAGSQQIAEDDVADDNHVPSAEDPFYEDYDIELYNVAGNPPLQPLQTAVASAPASPRIVPELAVSPSSADQVDDLVSDADSVFDPVLENTSETGITAPSSPQQPASSTPALRHTSRSPSRIDNVRREADRRRFRESHFRDARKRIMEKGIIVSVIPNPGPIKYLGNQVFRVKTLAGEVMCLVQDADDWDRAGGYAIFYRYKD